MAHPDLIPDTTPVLEIAEPHRSTVAAILYAAGQGLFTAAEADMLIDRVRTYALPLGPDRTFHDHTHRDSPTVI
jgi:gentisate 1,2-dioxygenase